MRSLSVIIPARNEEECLQDAISALHQNATMPQDLEIIVVDHQSSDRTAQIAKELGARVILFDGKAYGRAALLNLGAKAATGDVLFFVDADCIVPLHYDEEIRVALRGSSCVGGAFEFKLVGAEFGLRVVEFINRTRYRLWPWYYGDQGIFVRRKLFEQVGGYPSVSLMEASDFCRQLDLLGEMRLIHKDVLTSSRRFIEGGIYRVLGFDIRMWWRNMMGLDIEQFARSYWKSSA